jgi:fatty acid-binding protein DegV
MDLTTANTAVVLDSTADYPEGPARHPNWRIVPLYVRFGDESFRDYVELGPDEFYARLAGSREPPRTAAPSPGDFAAVYGELAGGGTRTLDRPR